MGSAVLAAAPLLASGCAATTSPDYDSVFGDATRLLSAQQTLDPQAVLRNEGAMPPADGRTVREAKDRYVEDYRAPAPTNIINIGLGGGGAR